MRANVSPLERLRHALANRMACVQLIGFDPTHQIQIARSLADVGYRVAAADDSIPESVSDSAPFGSGQPPDVVIWDTQLRTTLARGVDTQTLFDATTRIASILRPGQLLVVTGVVPPGTTRGLILPRLVADELHHRNDLYVAYAPSLEPGNTWILGGRDPDSLSAAVSFLTPLTPEVVPVSTVEAAELCGLIPRVYRTIQTALGNELRVLGDRLGASFWEAVGAVRLPELAPRAGDDDSATAFLTWGARRFDTTPRLCELASEVNAAVPAFLVAKLEETLNTQGRPLRESRILLWGSEQASKANAPTRPALSVELWTTLQKKGARVTTHAHGIANSPNSPTVTAKLLASQDAVVILADLEDFDYEFLVTHSQLVIDTQNATRNVVHGREKIVTV